MARDRRYTDAMRAATTHEGRGGNPKVGVPVGFTRPPPHTFFPIASPKQCLVCPPFLSQDSSAKLAHTPYDDYSARASSASPSNISEGHNASLVRELASALAVSYVTTAVHVCLALPAIPFVSAKFDFKCLPSLHVCFLSYVGLVGFRSFFLLNNFHL